jgi:hypothetical protein
MIAKAEAKLEWRSLAYDIHTEFAYTALMFVRLLRRFEFLLLLALILISRAAYALEERYNTGWRLNLDNDILAESDRDYTGGIALTLSGRRAQDYLISLEGVRNWLDDLLRVSRLYDDQSYFQLHSLQYGAMLFTPEDITDPAPIFDDRPYGSLFYLSNTELTVLPASDQAWMSTLTFGFLGLRAAEDIQRLIHALTDSDVANGWDNQISAGGEPTLMYTLSNQRNHIDSASAARRHQFKTVYEANAGFSTDVNASLSWRWGRIDTPWWSFNPQHAEYIQLGAPVSARESSGRRELYLWAGAGIKYRFYSALFQGQFRESIVTISSDQLEKLLGQIWLGATWEFADNIRGSLFYRASSKEFNGPNAHYPVWAGLIISRAY